ncbi:MAG TPA: class I SAM-dependent methyltransferase [Candidatus Paceibacterota bacterium]
MASSERFGYEWDTFSEMTPIYEEQFWKWVSPLTKKDFAGKSVLDAGCGMGRNAYWTAKAGAKEVVAFDLDDRSIAAAKKNLQKFPQTRVEKYSFYEIPFQDQFDIAFSIGVIHHLENPNLALQKMKMAVKPGGKVLIWVYGYEGNEWIVRLVSPVRKLITSRLPIWLLNYLTYFVSVPLWLLVKILPTKNTYLRQLKEFKLWHIHSICFDQLLPRIANYYRKDEARKLLVDVGLQNVEIYPCNGNSWTVIGVKR